MLGQRTTRRLQASWIVRLFVVLALLEAGSSNLYAAITDNGIHPPPTTGAYGYGSFIPGSPGFPAVGGTYVDPVFGETVRRITDIGAKQNNEDIYGHHWANANGSYVFSRTVNDTRILNPTTGAVVRSGVPCGSPCFEASWHPTNPDRYYYLNGSALVRVQRERGNQHHHPYLCRDAPKHGWVAQLDRRHGRSVRCDDRGKGEPLEAIDQPHLHQHRGSAGRGRRVGVD